MAEEPSKFSGVAEKSKAKQARLKATVAARDAEKARIDKVEEARRAKYGVFSCRFEAWDEGDLLNQSGLVESKPTRTGKPDKSEKSRETSLMMSKTSHLQHAAKRIRGHESQR